MKRKLFRQAWLALTLALLTVSSLSAQRVTPQNALASYLQNGDSAYGWSLSDSVHTEGATIYNGTLTSQRWQGMTLRHQLLVIVPERTVHSTALLFVTGGESDAKGMPVADAPDSKLVRDMTRTATENRAVTAVLYQTPVQPLYGGLREDALIAYTVGQFLQTGDYSWPLLFPMVKGAVRAMDAVQEFASSRLPEGVDGFVVSGMSKRGWTTWLTGAQDKRVKAIAPMVFDMLNFPVSIPYQTEALGGASEMIHDYTDAGVLELVNSEAGKAVILMLDPYAYRKLLTMPKMIVLASNDPYWATDAVKNYVDSLPGDNYIDYVPNAVHSIGDKTQSVALLSSFFGAVLNDALPAPCVAAIRETASAAEVTVTVPGSAASKAVLWMAEAPTRDFRKTVFRETPLPVRDGEILPFTVDYPQAGYRAFFVQLSTPAKDPAGNFVQTTRMYIVPGKR